MEEAETVKQTDELDEAERRLDVDEPASGPRKNMWQVEEMASFVKDRGADVLRKLSAKMEDLDRQVFEKGFEYMSLNDRFLGNDSEDPTASISSWQESRGACTSNIKGRILFFSTSGCEDCLAVRRILRKKGLPYFEINVDVYSHRKLELEERTGTSSLPQVFFNETFVGGIHELKAMELSRELDERLKQVFENECPPTAPMPPIPGEENDSLGGKHDELAEVARRLKEKVQIKDRIYKMHWFTKCFLGSEAVRILAENESCGREEAVQLGRKLVSKFFFQHVMQENGFEDGNEFYRFLEHDPIVMTYCHNFNGKASEEEPRSIQEVESSLQKVTLAIIEQYVSEDGKRVNYLGISTSAEFKRYLTIAQQLHRIDIFKASREEKLAFFINLYNMMILHAVIVLGHPDALLDRRNFFGNFHYLIGGHSYSLSAIENGVLRANQRPPYNLIKAFGPKDNRLKISLREPTPLVHFALCCATKSSPAISCYTSAEVDAELRFAARSFLKDGGLVIDAASKIVSLDQLFNWYDIDFGKSELEILTWCLDYLEPTKAEDLLQLLEGDLKVVYQPYDWSLNAST